MSKRRWNFLLGVFVTISLIIIITGFVLFMLGYDLNPSAGSPRRISEPLVLTGWILFGVGFGAFFTLFGITIYRSHKNKSTQIGNKGTK
jgi:uncharacterized membrane protein YsdA (DUF1294 family)